MPTTSTAFELGRGLDVVDDVGVERRHALADRGMEAGFFEDRARHGGVRGARIGGDHTIAAKPGERAGGRGALRSDSGGEDAALESLTARCSSAVVFITNGPCCAIGSPSGRPRRAAPAPARPRARRGGPRPPRVVAEQRHALDLDPGRRAGIADVDRAA
jgi:hypothetical protein